MVVRSAATTCAGWSVRCPFLYFLYFFVFLWEISVEFVYSDGLVLKCWRLFFSYRRNYRLIEGQDGINVGDGMVDLDFENLVHG